MPDRLTLCVYGVLAAAALILNDLAAAGADTWRVGDADHPWRLHPVSFEFTTGETFRPEFEWGGSFAAEVVVDDDGDGAVDEDPVDRIDNDGDRLWNEDPLDDIDNDLDGLVDEDGPDPQRDNDGDGLVNEDGLDTGGLIYSPALRQAYATAPFFRYRTAEEAAADEQGWTSGYGWGDDDDDARFNEDPRNGQDDDGDGLVDEDAPAPDPALPTRWTRPVFVYDASGLDSLARTELRFLSSTDAGGAPVLFAVTSRGDTVEAVLVRRSFRPTDWLRAILLDSTRNVARLTDNRFLAGLFGEQDPLQLGSQVGTPRYGDSGNGQVVDGSIATAKSVVGNWGFGTRLNGLFWLDRIRYYPRPNFPDRTPSSFQVRYGGDDPSDFRTTPLGTRLVASRFLIPEQIDRTRPVIKDFRLDPPQKVRLLSMGSRVREGDVWEIAEAEYYGHGSALDANYYSEILDVGPPRPRVRRYFDKDEPWRSIPFELIRTVDVDGDGSISSDEEANATAREQFDTDLPGDPVNWGRLRWHGSREGVGGDLEVRVRAGTGLDQRIYQRRLGPGIGSSFVGAPITLDWPSRGSRLDAHSYVALPSIARLPYAELPANKFGTQDGMPGGWTPWSAPFDFDEGLVDRDAGGGVLLSLPPLTRYVQFRIDFEPTEDSAVRLDYLEFDYSRPVVSRGVTAEIFPDTAAVLGVPIPLQYVLRPRFGDGVTVGFNRIDITVPSLDARVDSLLYDGRRWRAVEDPGEPKDPDARAAWLTSLELTESGVFASTVYRDGERGLRLGIKTAPLTIEEFPTGQDRDVRIHLHTSLFTLLTRFESWVWHDGRGTSIPQPTMPGNAAEELPADGVSVIVNQAVPTLGQLAVAPNPFSPNGDGINDTVEFNFSLFLFLQGARVRVEIATLAGTEVRTLGPISRAVGRYAIAWDGLDDAGQPVPPGLYLYRFTALGDGAEEAKVGVVAVTY